MAKKSNTAIDPKSALDFTMALDEFAKQVGGDLEMIGREQIRLMCRDAMNFTPPMPKGGGRGLSVAAHKAGKNKLGNDVRRIFIPMDEPRRAMPVFLKKLTNSVRSDDYQQYYELYTEHTQANAKKLSPVLRKILEDPDRNRSWKKAKNYLSKANIFGNIRDIGPMTSDLRSIHDKYKGKVNGRWKRNAPIGGPQYMVESMNSLQAYIADRQLKVGRVKSGWAALLRQVPKPTDKKGQSRNFGSYNAPWVDANIRAGQGIFSQSVGKSRVSMTIQNLIGNINNVAKDAGTENIVYGNRVRQIKATVEARVRDAIERANRKKNQ